jgi:hypothetical protein
MRSVAGRAGGVAFLFCLGLAAGWARGAIIYNNEPSYYWYSVVGPHGHPGIDLDGDGSDDLSFSASGQQLGLVQRSEASVAPRAGLSLIGPLQYGIVIGLGSGPARDFGPGVEADNAFPYHISDSAGGLYGFVLPAADGTHYGWVQLELMANITSNGPFERIVSGPWAYESTPTRPSSPATCRNRGR